jgi:hypothetical protein
LYTFMVDYDWPSGEYRLHIDGAETGLKLRVENFDTRRDGWNFTPPDMMYSVQANFGDKIELLGYDLPTRRVKTGGGIPLVLYWRGLLQMREDYTIFVQLLDADLERWGGYDRFPRETYNTFLWVPGEVVDDGFAVPVNPDAPDGVYTIRVGLYEQENEQITVLPLVQDGQPLAETSVVIGPVKIGGPPPEVALSAQEVRPEAPLSIELGEPPVILWHGYDLVQEDEALRLTLYWESLAETPVDWSIFTHLRNQAGETVAQRDGSAGRGHYPTSLWDTGEIISDEISLSLPAELPPGEYNLVVGLYDLTTGQRLSVPVSLNDEVILTTLELSSP